MRSASPAIRYEHRIFLVGKTRSGKSHLARALFLSAAAPRLIVDPADSSLTDVPGAVTFSNPKRPPADAETARFVPYDPADRDAYNDVYRWAFERFPRYVWLDEAGQAAPAAGGPRWLNTYLVQGAKRSLGHLACHGRPREINRNLIAMASHLFIFDTPNPDDRRYIADMVGLPPAQLEAELIALPKFGYLWWNGEELTSCPPYEGPL